MIIPLAFARVVSKFSSAVNLLRNDKVPLATLVAASLFCLVVQPAGAVTLTGASIGTGTGSVIPNSADSFTVNGTGAGIWYSQYATDSAYCAYASYTGDVEVVARLVSFSYPANQSEAGLIIRNSLNPTEVNRACTFYSNRDSGAHCLGLAGGAPLVNGDPFFLGMGGTYPRGVNPPYWMKLVRVGNNFGAYWSLDGRDWNLINNSSGGANCGIGAMNVGLFVSSGGSGTLATAAFDNVYIGPPRLKYKTSWVGSTSGGFATRWPSADIFALWVKNDGTCYANGCFSEGGFPAMAYKDGKVAFNLPSGGGVYEGTITGNANNLFMATSTGGNKVYRTDFNGLNPVQVSFTATLGQAGGLAASTDRLFVSDRTNNTVRIVDLMATTPTEITLAKTGPLLAGLPNPGVINHPGPIAYDGTNFWITDCGSAFPLNFYITPQSGYTPAIKCFDRDGNYLGRYITDVSNPTALAKHPNSTLDRLYVCDNGPSQNIRYYTGLAVAGNHTYAGTFGQDKGLWPTGSANPGKITDSAFGGDKRFYGPTGVGFDSSENIYVACEGTNGNGLDLRKFTSAGTLVWRQLGLEFVNAGDFDPASDTIYTTEERFNMNYANTAPGSEWSYTAFTANPFQANDIRNDLNAKPHGVQVRRLAGNNVFMFTNGMGTADTCMLYRFNNQDGAPGYPGVQGTTAIPCGSILPVSGGMKLWIDRNADGLVTTGATPPEETTIPCTLGGYSSYDVDSQGSIWLAFPSSIPSSIMQVPCTGTLTVSTTTPPVKLPDYNLAGSKIFRCPEPIQQLWSIKYDKANDVMYCMGKKADGKWVLVRSDNWLATPAIEERSARYVVLLPEYGADLTMLAPPGAPDYYLGYRGMGFAGDKVFIADVWGPIRVYDANLGNFVLTLNVGPEMSATSAWEDMMMGVNAIKRSNGEYLVLEENDGWQRSIPLYRWTPAADTSTTAAPTTLTATAQGRKVVLAWTGPTGMVTSYKIYRSTSSGTETLYQSGIATATFTDLDVTPGVTYYYKVTAVNAAGESAQSNEDSATPSATQVEFVKTDTTTQGTWYTGTTPTGSYVYGSEGYEICANATSFPPYATVSNAVAAPTATPYPAPTPAPYIGTWAASTSEVRALRKPSSATDRIAAYRASGFFSIVPWSWNVDVGTDWHQVAVYMLDWEGDRGDHQVKIYDNTNGAPGSLLDTRRLTNFSQGQYLVWNIRGKVRIEISEFANPQNTTVASGIFFDPVKTSPPTKAWWKLDDTSGQPAADSSGAGNYAYKITGSWNAAGKINGCVDFNGPISGSNLSLPTLLFNLPKMTMSLWFKTATSGVLLGMQHQLPGPPPTNYCPVLYVGTDNKLHGAFYTGAIRTMTSTASVTSSTDWHHAALTSDGLIQTLYLDGEVVGMQVAPVSVLGYAWGAQGYTGGYPGGNGGVLYLTGKLDEMRLYDRVLPKSEIWKLAKP